VTKGIGAAIVLAGSVAALAAAVSTTPATDIACAGNLVRRWGIERERSSEATVTQDGPAGACQLMFGYALGPGTPVDQFAALVGAIPRAALVPYDRLTFSARANRPLRMVVELRPGGADNPPRWIRSVYLDSSPRDVTVFFDDMRPTPPARGRVPLDTIEALMFVVDTTNTKPGTRGEIAFGRIALGRDGRLSTTDY
jgi:hypothetical protein